MTRSQPAVVAIGGGHGLAMTLRAVRTYTADITAVVSVADDGGSTGRLRRDLGVLGVGDLRKCMVALAGTDDDEPIWADAFEYRYPAGELEGHALGNLLLVGLAEVTGDWGRALEVAGRLIGAVGRVLPATSEPVVLKAEVDSGRVEGQVAVQNSVEQILSVALVPGDAASPPGLAAAIASADQIVLAPGSLFTSVLPTLCVDAVRDGLARSSAPIVQVVNLAVQVPETAGLDTTDHLRRVLDAGVAVRHLVVDHAGTLAIDPAAIAALGVNLVVGDVARPDVRAHEPAKLASVLAALLES